MTQVTPQSDAPERPRRSWFPLNVGTALALAAIFGLLAFMLTSNGESSVAAGDETVDSVVDDVTEPAALSAPEPAVTVAPPPARDGGAVEETREVAAITPTTIAAASSFADGGGDAALSSRAVLTMASEITNMGPTEVGFVTNFPSVGYTWERIEVPAAGQFDIGWLGELGGRLVAVSPSWEAGFEPSGQSLLTSVSTDGRDWEVAGAFALPADTWVSQVVSDGELVYAFADSWVQETGGNQHIVYTTSDGASWTATELELDTQDNEHVYIQNAAAGPAGVAVAVSFESYPEEQPALLDFGEVLVELDHMRGTYRLIDAASEEELLSGKTDGLFNWGADGQRVYDPETGELLVTIPYDVWEQAFMHYYEGYGGGSPLLPTPWVEPAAPSEITIEYEGFIVTVDEYGGEYRVVAADSGDVVAVGSMDYLYQGPPPSFVDPESGAVLLRVTWDEWYRAEEQSYMYREERFFEYTSRTALVTSTDGRNWAVESIPTRSGAHVSYIVATADGFVAMVNSYGEYGDHRSVWTMTNGEWSSTEADYTDLWLYQVVDAGDRLLGVGEGTGGPALWSSTNGVNWISEFAIVPQDDGSYVSLADVAADGNNTVGALARREKWSEYQPVVIEKDGYTLTFEDGETLLSVVDSGGETVLILGWQEFESEAGSELVTWEDGVTYIDLGNGDTVAIPDEEAYAAMEARWADQGQLGLSVFLNDGVTWTEAMVEVEGTLSGAHQLFFADGRIIIGGIDWGDHQPYESALPAESSLVIIVGTPVGG